MNLELKVGLLVVLTVATFILMGYLTKEIDFGSDKNYRVYYTVPDANKLYVGAEVFFRGMRVGTLGDIEVHPQNITLGIDIYKDVKIPDSVELTLQKDSFLGTSSISFSQPASKPSSEYYLQAGKVYDNYVPSATLTQIQDEILKFIGQLNNMAPNLNSTVDNLAQVTQDVRKFTGSSALGDLKDTMAQVKKFSMQLNNVLDSDSAAQLKDSMAHLDQIMKKLDKLVDNNSEKITGIVDDLHNITAGIDNGNGTLGMLLKNETTQEDVKEIIKKVRNMTDGLDNIHIALDAYGYKYSDGMGGEANLYIIPGRDKYYKIGFTSSRYGQTKYTQTKRERRDENGSKIYNYTETQEETNKNAIGVNLLYGKRFNRITVEGGVIATTFGFGVYYDMLEDRNLQFMMRGWDFSNPYYSAHLQAGFNYAVTNNINLRVGYDDFLNKKRASAYIGGGLYFRDDDLKYVAGSISGASGGLK